MSISLYMGCTSLLHISIYVFSKKKKKETPKFLHQTQHFSNGSPCNGPNHSSPGNSHRNHSILGSPYSVQDAGGFNPAPFRAASSVQIPCRSWFHHWAPQHDVAPDSLLQMLPERWKTSGCFCCWSFWCQVLTPAMFNEKY